MGNRAKAPKYCLLLVVVVAVAVGQGARTGDAIYHWSRNGRDLNEC
jgi:hypothetical protein